MQQNYRHVVCCSITILKHQSIYQNDHSQVLVIISVKSTIIRRVAEIQNFEKTYLIVIKDETGLKFKMNDSTLFLIGSYAQKLEASY